MQFLSEALVVGLVAVGLVGCRSSGGRSSGSRSSGSDPQRACFTDFDYCLDLSDFDLNGYTYYLFVCLLCVSCLLYYVSAFFICSLFFLCQWVLLHSQCVNKLETCMPFRNSTFGNWVIFDTNFNNRTFSNPIFRNMAFRKLYLYLIYFIFYIQLPKVVRLLLVLSRLRKGVLFWIPSS